MSTLVVDTQDPGIIIVITTIGTRGPYESSFQVSDPVRTPVNYTHILCKCTCRL